MNEYYSSAQPHIPPYDPYDNSATYSLSGAWSVVLPRGMQSHTSTVSDNSITGHFRGSYEGTTNWGTHSTYATLSTTFHITGAGNTVQIFMNGSSSGGGFFKQSTPEGLNPYVGIYNAVTNTVVFDSFDYATSMTFDPTYSRGSITWTNVSKSLALAEGDYRIVIGAVNKTISFPGGGSDRTASTSFDASVTFIPSPGVGAIAAAAALFAAQRRRD